MDGFYSCVRSFSANHFIKLSPNNQLQWTFYTPFVLCIALRSIFPQYNRRIKRH